MEEKLLDYIKELSLRDKKTLTEKALKVTEEVGELARVILPFDNVPGTKHRFIEKGKILEEVSDIILTAISVVYQLGYTHDDVENMMRVKAEKWQGIQVKEDKVVYPLPYEIHVTIKHPGFDSDHQNLIYNFVDACKEIGVKPIVLDLENGGENVMEDVMTSSHHFGDNRSVYEEASSIKLKLQAKGFEVLRVKIETVPWHPAAPMIESEKMPKDCYFEAHIGCIISIEEKEKLAKSAEIFGAHLSRNAFKKIEDGKFVNMVTLRNYDCSYDWFKGDVECFTNSLKCDGFLFDKVITEFCLYDTKVSHDYLWLK